MSIPKEPRQIMINLMYLVLTALLALNVSNEILNAFKTLSLSIDKSNKSIDQKNIDVYQAIKDNEKAPGQEEKVKPFRMKADEVVKEADAMVAFLNNWKRRITIEAGGYNKEGEDTALPQRPDNIDATTSLLVEKKGGDTLKQKITDMRKFFLAQVKPNDSGSISPLMPLRVVPARKNDHNPTGDWNIENFEHMPAIAAIALFSKFQNDVRSSEALVLNKLFEEAHMKDIKFDTIGAIAIPKQSYVLDGDKVEASILMAAFNRSNNPVVTITQGGGQKKDAKDGVIPWETVASGTGMQTVKGKIVLHTDAGDQTRDWQFQYMVGTTGASMQLDKMNVFYIGVDNPVTVAAAGYSVEDVSLDIPGATVTGGKGHYVINVTQKGDVDVKIMAQTKDAGKKQVGGLKVRVKRIPDPIAKLLDKTGGTMSVGLFRNAIAPAAVLDNFDFDAKFLVVGFTFSMLPKGRDYVGPFVVENRNGCRFHDQVDAYKAQQSARAGDKVFIETIKAVGPDKVVRTLPGSILLTLTN
jgi:gliding motility-associated protein GldM